MGYGGQEEMGYGLGRQEEFYRGVGGYGGGGGGGGGGMTFRHGDQVYRVPPEYVTQNGDIR